MHSVTVLITNAFSMDIYIVITGIKHVFIRFIKMALSSMEGCG